MSINRIETIKSVLVTKLEGMTHLRHVYDYQKAEPTGFPFAIVTLGDFDGDFGDWGTSNRNIRNWNFIVKIYVDRDEGSFGSEKGERVAVETTDEILIALDTDVTLGGEVKQVKVVSGSFDNETIGNTVRVAELVISCMDLVSA